MTYSIVIDGKDMFDLSTVGGWKKMRRWVHTNGGPKLKEFLEESETDDVPALKDEVSYLLKSRQDIPTDIRSTLSHMKTVSLSLGKTAYITDGLS